VLFNTLAFAKFFALVFVVSWLLVTRRHALLLPWFAVGAYLVTGPRSALHLALGVASLGLTLGLCRASPRDQIPRLALGVTSVTTNLLALSWLTLHDQGTDPITLVLAGFGVSLGRSLGGSLVALLAVAALGTWLVRAQRVRMVFILLASYVFYAHWDWRFLPLIWGSSTCDWLLGNAIARAPDSRRRKHWLLGTVCVNLGVLAVFKYFNFGVDSARAVLGALGYHPPEIVLRVALPVGISFFTFESMSYVIDIYRGVIRPQKSYVEYLAFVAFFPHLVAGPIVRPRDLLPQLAGPARWSNAEASEALFLIALGLLKKVAVGDYLALNLVDRVFDAPLQYSALECYAAVVGYAVQIYCDFSGYTDIAIGTALLIGVRMPLNFNAPYKAPDIVDFWRRWHISLSTWLRDYLYISLGGNRKGRARAYLNQMLTMLLGGLWHGASWTFVVWGGLHGFALAVTRAYGEARPGWRRPVAALLPAFVAGPLLGGVMCVLIGATDATLFWRFAAVGWALGAALALAAVQRAWGTARSSWWRRAVTALSVLGTFHVVCAGWVFFRAESFHQAAVYFAQLLSFTSYHPNLRAGLVGALAVGMLTHWAPEPWYAWLRRQFIALPAPAQGLALFGAGLVLREMAGAEAVPFVYFQF
jgi:D-alanyl-lipoteichoic acid acyltransferase DltB (MBOAT superfamily)